MKRNTREKRSEIKVVGRRELSVVAGCDGMPINYPPSKEPTDPGVTG